MSEQGRHGGPITAKELVEKLGGSGIGRSGTCSSMNEVGQNQRIASRSWSRASGRVAFIRTAGRIPPISIGKIWIPLWTESLPKLKSYRKYPQNLRVQFLIAPKETKEEALSRR